MDLTLLDVAIGMVLIYSLLSLICSTINEGLASYLSLRAVTLKAGLENLLGADLATQVYDHHLVQGLVQQDLFFKWRRKPSYIPTRTFVLTVLDTLNGGFPTSADEVRLAVQKVPDPKIQRALLALVDEAKGDLDEVKKNFGVWFDHSMDRVSGWYRRKVQFFILLIGIAVSASAWGSTPPPRRSSCGGIPPCGRRWSRPRRSRSRRARRPPRRQLRRPLQGLGI